jgi:hypothetical protein
MLALIVDESELPKAVITFADSGWITMVVTSATPKAAIIHDVITSAFT